MHTDLRSRLEREKEERRNLEQGFTLRYRMFNTYKNDIVKNFNIIRLSDFNSVINEDKIKFAETLRLVENVKREINQNHEVERSRLNTALIESRELITHHANEKIEKIKDDIYGRIRDLERVRTFITHLSFIIVA